MKKILFIKKAIAYFVVFFVIISLNNICNAITFDDLVKKYNKLVYDEQTNVLMYKINYTMDSTSQMINKKETVEQKLSNDGIENANDIENNDDITPDEENQKKGNTSNNILTEDAKLSAECNHKYFKLSSGYLVGVHTSEWSLFAQRGEIFLENVTYTIENRLESNKEPTFKLTDKGYLHISFSPSSLNNILKVTIYYYREKDGKWYKDTCIIKNDGLMSGAPTRRKEREHANRSFYVLTGKKSMPGYTDRLYVDVGKTKQSYINRHTDTPLLKQASFSPLITNVEMEYDNEYIDVSFKDNHFYITGKKVGSSYLRISFVATQDDLIIVNQGLDKFINGYFEVFASIEVINSGDVEGYYIIDPDENNNNEDEDENVDEDELRIPESISFTYDGPLYAGETYGFDVLCDGEKDYTENYSWTQFISENTEVGDFSLNDATAFHSVLFHAKKAGITKITLTKTIQRGLENIETLRYERLIEVKH